VSYKRKELRVLSGSLNLLTPGDKIPATDAMQMENWRVDQNGALVCRNGVEFVAAVTNTPNEDGDIHTMAGNYVGYGTKLARITWSGGGVSSPTVIATGLSGKPFGIASMNGFAWIMDQNVQGRDDGTTFTTGVPQPPGTAPVADPNPFPADPNGLLPGTYVYYVTFLTTIGETNPSPPSGEITLIGSLQGGQLVPGQDVVLDSIPTSTDPTVIGRNIYREGGTLGAPTLVGTINDNTTTTFTDKMNDTAAAAEGRILEFDHNPPPAAQGLAGPYFGRLLAFNSKDHPNRMWWTKPGEPQYWPGANEDDGQWVDIGNSDEAIVQTTPHARMAIIYKEYSIWRLIGDPDTGTLEVANTRYGLFGPRAVANAGSVDYFAGTSGGLRGLFSTSDGVNVTKLTQKLDPLFLATETVLASGSTIWPVDPARLAQCALEAIGNMVVFSYPETAVQFNGNTASVVYCTDTQNLAMLRVGTGGATGGELRTGFTCLTYAGDMLAGGLGGWVVRIDQALGLQAGAAPDLGNPIQLFYQSRFEDCGYPDNQKVWLDLVIDAETNGNNLVVKTALDNGEQPLVTLGGFQNTERGKYTFALNEIEATNLAIVLNCAASGPGVRIHAMYLYYYVEARLADSIVTVPFQLGAGRVVQVKELQVDSDTSQGPATVAMLSDLPGNALASRMSASVAKGSRRLLQLPVQQAIFEGRLFQFLMTAQQGPFRLYGARALIRVVGTYIEAYEAASGFVWDSMEQDFSTGITHIPRGYAISLYANPIKRAREIALQIATSGAAVIVELWTDLPGDSQAKRASFTVNTGATQTSIFDRQEVRLPLPAGTAAPIEGRFFRLRISGTSQFKLYEAAIEIIPLGVYIEAYEAAGGAVYDSREIDLGTPKVKEGREIELDIETAGATVSILTDLPSGVMTEVFTAQVATSGRQQVLLALNPLGITPSEGRLWRLIITGTNSLRLYGARLLARPFGQYLVGGEGTSGAYWDSTELDLGAQQVKQIREIELDVWAYGPATVTVYTDLPGNAMQARLSKTISQTSGRTQVQIPLPQGGVPENYLFGRLVRVTVQSPQSVKLFGARVHARAIGVYVEGYEAQQGAVWDSTTIDLGSLAVKFWDEVRFECDSDGPVQLAVWTELPGEVMAEQFSGVLTAVAMSRGWATIALPPGVQGRSARLIASGPFGFRIYKAQVRARAIGRYIAAANAGNQDIFRTMDFDYGTERVKEIKKIELDIETDGAGAFVVTVYTNQSGVMAQVFQQTYATSGKRQTIKQYLPLSTRGRLMRLEVTSATAGIIYRLRAWVRPLTEPGAGWGWAEYPVEPSAELPEWSNLPLPETPPVFTWQDLPVEPTPPQWSWAPFPVAPTEPQWQWAKVLSVEGTSDKWEWVDLPGTVDPAIAGEPQ
jgi:hypothetical protein